MRVVAAMRYEVRTGNIPEQRESNFSLSKIFPVNISSYSSFERTYRQHSLWGTSLSLALSIFKDFKHLSPTFERTNDVVKFSELWHVLMLGSLFYLFLGLEEKPRELNSPYLK